MGSVPCVRGHRPELPRGGLPFISQRTSLDTVIQPWAFDGFQLYPATRPGSGTPARCLPRLVLFSQHTSLWPFLFLTAAHMRPALRSSRNRYLPWGLSRAIYRNVGQCWEVYYHPHPLRGYIVFTFHRQQKAVPASFPNISYYCDGECTTGGNFLLELRVQRNS